MLSQREHEDEGKEMSLTRENVLNSIQRVMVMHHFTPEDTTLYANTILESCGWMQPDNFDLVCKEVVTGYRGKGRPAPPVFIEHHKALSQRLGWSRPHQVELDNDAIMRSLIAEHTPRSARRVLEQIDEKKVRMSDWIVKELLLKAGQDIEEPEPFVVEKTVPPGIAHLSAEEIAELNREADELGIPF